MKKTLFFSFLLSLLFVVKVSAQNPTAPATETTKPAKDKTEKMKHAEERSGGHAYSGRGKGGEKNTTDPAENGKGRGKGQGKGKGQGQGKKMDDEKGERHHEGHGHDEMEEVSEGAGEHHGDKKEKMGNGKMKEHGRQKSETTKNRKPKTAPTEPVKVERKSSTSQQR